MKPVFDAAAGFLTITVSLMSTFQSPEYRAFRATLFAALGLWGIVPGVHALLLYGASHHLQKAVALDVLMGAFYLVSPVPSTLTCKRLCRVFEANKQTTSLSPGRAARHLSATPVSQGCKLAPDFWNWSESSFIVLTVKLRSRVGMRPSV